MIQKRLASEILKCSPKRVSLDSASLEEIGEAITKADVRRLIVKGIIRKLPEKGVSRVRVRQKRTKRNEGSKKGRKTARLPRKEAWKNTIRLQRALLRELRSKKAITPQVYGMLYLKAKGGFFRSKRHLALYMAEHGLRKK